MHPRTIEPPARTHAEAARLLQRPFAPGAIGFRAMGKTHLGGDPYGGAQVAAYVNAQSILARLNTVAPGRWRQRFAPLPAGLESPDGERRYLACQLILTLPLVDGGPDMDAVYEDVGELDAGSLAGLKALYSDARKRAAVAAGIGAYLYTTLEPVVLAIGPNPRQVQAIHRAGRRDLLVLSAETEQWLRDGYAARIGSDAGPHHARRPATPTPAATQLPPSPPAPRSSGASPALGRPPITPPLPGAPAPARAPAVAPAADLAARITVPRALPVRVDGEP